MAGAVSGGARPGAGRKLGYDPVETAAEYARLDALSRTRALTLTESLALECCIHRIDGRGVWRRAKGRRP